MFYEEIIGEFCVLFFPFVLLLIFKFLTKGGLNSDLHFRYVVSSSNCVNFKSLIVIFFVLKDL